ncbi:hypothetical protein [Psychrobacter pygoscelis]|uniref:hypothetical protein n=1 Tax=Psychrobacter pygoscelis TaxID=2488563 RepID=UPI00103F77D1|nr:hypothetical protein [Psychrobacter pygoscelis]
MIVLRGLLENVLGNYPCIRGYATLGDLAKISRTDVSFQREINSEHKQEIADFYERGKNVFFSEIIMAIDIDDHATNFSSNPNSKDILIKDDTKGSPIELTANQSKLVDQSSDNPKIVRNVALRLDTDYALEEKPFTRVDGNHRLQAVDGLDQSQLNKMCPFCIILFSSGGYDIGQVQQSVIFHNINSKGLALTSEETLKGIFEASGYDDGDLKIDMGWEYVLTRKIHSDLGFDHLQDIKLVFEQKARSILVDIIKFFHEEGIIENDLEDVSIFNKSISLVNQLYGESPSLNNDKTIFIAIFYYTYREFKNHPERSNTLNSQPAKCFIKWLVNNHMCKVALESPKELVKIYNGLHDNEVKIFMAMPYYSEAKVTDYNEALITVVQKIRKENPHINLSNYSIMANHSPAHNIIVDIFKKIDNCQIFIADITNNNANVLYEYGYAKGRDKRCILLENQEKKEEAIKSDYGNDLRFMFNGDSDLRNHLRTEIYSVLEDLGYELN